MMVSASVAILDGKAFWRINTSKSTRSLSTGIVWGSPGHASCVDTTPPSLIGASAGGVTREGDGVCCGTGVGMEGGGIPEP